MRLNTGRAVSARPFLLATLLLALAACGPSSPAPESAPVKPETPAKAEPPYPVRAFESAENGVLAAMTRHGCGMRCPSYRVSVSADGQVRYQGIAQVAVGGAAQARAEAADLARLKQLLDQPEARALGTQYVQGKTCGTWTSDSEVVELQLRLGDRLRTIRHDHGCPEAPALLTEIETAIDRAAGSARWVEGRADR